MLANLVLRLVDASARFRWLVVLAWLGLAALGVYYSANHFAIDTDTGRLISPDVGWRKDEMAFDRAFPDFASTIVVVIDALTPESADAAAAALADKLRHAGPTIVGVFQPDASRLFTVDGLLFLSREEVERTTENMIKAQPLLGALARDPTLRGLADLLTTFGEAITQGDATGEAVARPIARLGDAFDEILSGRPLTFSWREVMSDAKTAPRDLRRILIVNPTLDYTDLQPGNAATRVIRDAAASLGLDSHAGVRVRLTGDVPLADEEFGTLAEGAGLNSAITLIVIAIILKLALTSVRIIVAVLVSLFVGLAITTAAGLFMVTALNPISLAFAVLFVGLGVDFGIQFSVRYRDERSRESDLEGALREAARRAGKPLALAAIAVALGFLAFEPTAYRGLSDLGRIAGFGMVVSLATSVTLLPALIAILRPPGEPHAMGYRALAPLDHFLATHRRGVLIGTFAVVIAGLPLLLYVRFDFNPMNLRSAAVESVATYYDLAVDPESSPNTLNVLAPSLTDADRLAGELARLPEVDHVETPSTYVPGDQAAKLDLIADAATLLLPTLDPGTAPPAPSDAEIVAALRKAANALAASAPRAGVAEPGVRRLRALLTQLSDAAPDRRVAAGAALLPGFLLVLDQLKQELSASEVTLANLPDDIRKQWETADGQAVVKVFPKHDGDNEAISRFVEAVKRVAPHATGAPVAIKESGETVVAAFLQAGAYALISIAVLLAVVLRRPVDVLLTLVPLLLAGVVTLEICVLIGLKLNFANIIALPLLLGVGVAFKIYFVMAWRAGATNLLQSGLTRAVFFSALTTATAFGSLLFSHHPGTASMGKLLALSLMTTLAAAVLFQPILMGPPRTTPEAEA